MVGTTTNDLYIWRVGFPGNYFLKILNPKLGIVLGTYLSVTCLRASSEGFFLGNLAGEIIFVNPKTNTTEFLVVNTKSVDVAAEVRRVGNISVNNLFSGILRVR